jgi:starch phosphorylase
LLDSNLDQNPEHFRRLTDQLYRSDDVWWKIFQRAILGIGGVKALESLRYSIDCYHLNEGHAAFALLEKYVTLDDKTKMDQVKEKFVFTCHTPVAAGHDRFHINDVARVLKREYVEAAQIFGKERQDSDQINLTYMSLHNCPKVNAVSEKHGEIMRLQFPDFAQKIQSITNGVHLHTWISESFQELFDKYEKVFKDWRRDPSNLANVERLRNNDQFRKDLFEAHQLNKRELIAVEKILPFREDILTVGWARRFANYKRPSLIFQNIKQLVELANEFGPLQIMIAGKAHPQDNVGAAHILEIFRHLNELNEHKNLVKVLILENYDTYFGKLLTNSVDVWLNNPLPPFEASGTSGMKAILNGVLQLSTVDGWVVEAEKDDIGWFFGYRHSGPEIGNESQLRLDEDSQALNNTLKKVLELYHQTYNKGKINTKSAWIDKMINCIRKSAFFNTQRMIEQYRKEVWQFPH